MIQFKTVLCRLAKRMAILALLMATSVPKMNAQLAFSPPQKLTNSSASFNVPGEQLIAVDALGNVNVAWNASSNHADAMFSRSIDGGLTFSAPINVSNNPGGAILTSLAVDSGGNIYLIWTGSTNLAGQPNAIFFTRSTDGGCGQVAPMFNVAPIARCSSAGPATVALLSLLRSRCQTTRRNSRRWPSIPAAILTLSGTSK